MKTDFNKLNNEEILLLSNALSIAGYTFDEYIIKTNNIHNDLKNTSISANDLLDKLSTIRGLV